MESVQRMANKLSDREYVKQILDDMDGKTNHMKAKAIARLFGGEDTAATPGGRYGGSNSGLRGRFPQRWNQM